MGQAWFSNDTPGLEHFWHPVAFSHEVVSDAPTRVELLGRRWVVVRSGAEIVAFRDECPHRRASLSGGRIVDETIECPYHGWRYDLTGQCVKIPALAEDTHAASRVRLSAPYAVSEYAGLVWMAIDEPLEPIIDWPQWQAPGWDAWWLSLRVTTVNGGLLTENFMDATHFAYVHRDTFGANSPSMGVEHCSRDGWQMSTSFPQVTYQPGLGNVTAEVTTELRGPFCLRMLISAEAGSRAFTFFLQPVNSGETRLYLGVACDGLGGDVDQMKAESEFNDRVYDEDLVVLEDFAEPRLPLGAAIEVSTPADVNLLRYRQLLGDISRLGNG